VVQDLPFGRRTSGFAFGRTPQAGEHIAYPSQCGGSIRVGDGNCFCLSEVISRHLAVLLPLLFVDAYNHEIRIPENGKVVVDDQDIKQDVSSCRVAELTLRETSSCALRGANPPLGLSNGKIMDGISQAGTKDLARR
jgi:hypothetical protein